MYIVSTCPLHSKLASVYRPASLVHADMPTTALWLTRSQTPCHFFIHHVFHRPQKVSIIFLSLGLTVCSVTVTVCFVSASSTCLLLHHSPPIPWHRRCASIAITFRWSLLRHLLAAYFCKRPGAHRVSSLAPSTLQKNTLPFSPQRTTNSCPPRMLLTFSTTVMKYSPTSASVTLQHSLLMAFSNNVSLQPFLPSYHLATSWIRTRCARNRALSLSFQWQPQGGQSFFERKMLLGLAMQPPACARVSTTAPNHVCSHFTIPNPAANLDCPENRPGKNSIPAKKGFTPNNPWRKLLCPWKEISNQPAPGWRSRSLLHDLVCSQFIYNFGGCRFRKL